MAEARFEVIFALPVLVPFPDGYGITVRSGGPDGPATHLTFRWVENLTSTVYLALRTVASAEWGEEVTDPGPGDTFRDRMTIVVASTPVGGLPDDEPDEELADPQLARVVRLVDDIVEAWALHTGQPVPRIGPRTMFPIVLHRWVNKRGKAGRVTVGVLDSQKTARERVQRLTPMTSAAIADVARIAGRLDPVRAGRPYYAAVRLLASAERAFNARELEAAIVSAASSVEAMGWELVRSMMGEEGRTPPSPVTAFRNLLEHHLLPRLDLGIRTPDVAHWLTAGYEMRHAVVHGGHRATLAEALEAARAAEALGRRIDEALVAVVSRYPRTAARKIGRPLLERTAHDPRLEEIVEEENASPILVGVIQDAEEE